jgi:glycosyltransferase involved in cell wall biosynthesis
MRKIKLLYATGANGGGALKNITDLATHLNPENFEISVVLSTGKQSIETQIAVSKIERKQIHIKYIPIPKTISPADIISLVKIYFYLKKNLFDIVHAHSSKAGALFRLAAFFAKVPVVVYTPHCISLRLRDIKDIFTGYWNGFLSGLLIMLLFRRQSKKLLRNVV